VITAIPEQTLSKSETRILALASVGGALEFYDFVIFVFFAGPLGTLFFAAGLPDWVRQLQTFGIFAAGYLARPLGGIIMAHFGDLHGRKRMFSLSVLLMAIPTLLIGLLPTYRSIGALAPLLLLSMRILQGVAIGGEAPGAWVFVAEHADRRRVGLAIGLLTSGLTFGILLGSLMATGLNLTFTPRQIVAWAWRIPFVTGGIFGLLAMWLRQWLSETPVFIAIRKRAESSQDAPLRIVLKSHLRSTFASMLSTLMLCSAIVVVILMTPTLLPKLFAVSISQVQSANLLATTTLCLSAVLVGAAVDRFGVTKVSVPMMLLMILSTCALYLGAKAGMQSAITPLYAIAGLGAGGVVLTPIVLVRAFPAAVRFTGVSFSYNIAYALFGGLAPLAVSWLAHFNRLAPAYFVSASAVISLIAILIAPSHPIGELDRWKADTSTVR
jgi:MFS family permease